MVYIMQRQWYEVQLKRRKQRDEQIAYLVDKLNLKCDKYEARMLHEFAGLARFHAFLTREEARKLSKRKLVRHVKLGEPKQRARPRFEEQKQSLGSRLSEARKNKEKWRYDEDLEMDEATLKPGIEDWDEDEDEEHEYYYTSNYKGCERYCRFDAAGKRWYVVDLVDDMHPDDQMALVMDTLDCSDSEIDSVFKDGTYLHSFQAYLTEEQADEFAGLEEVEYVEPLRYMSFSSYFYLVEN